MVESDRDLVEAVIAGRAGAIDRFVDRHARMVFWVARCETGLGLQDADAVLQRVFMCLLDDDARRLRDWQGDEVEPYLRQVARNEAIAFSREMARTGQGRPDVESPPDFADRAFDAAARAQLSDVRDCLADCYDRLAPAERRVVVFHYQDELDQRSIAIMLGLTPAAASQRVARATRRLRGCLSTKLGRKRWVLA